MTVYQRIGVPEIMGNNKPPNVDIDWVAARNAGVFQFWASNDSVINVIVPDCKNGNGNKKNIVWDYKKQSNLHRYTRRDTRRQQKSERTKTVHSAHRKGYTWSPVILSCRTGVGKLAMSKFVITETDMITIIDVKTPFPKLLIQWLLDKLKWWIHWSRTAKIWTVAAMLSTKLEAGLTLW